MAAIDYLAIAVGALTALVDAGQAVTLHRMGGHDGVFVPGQPLEPTSTDYPGTGALVGYKQSAIDGVSILQGDQQLLLAPQVGVAPQSGDTVAVAGVVYNIINVAVVAPAGVPVLYKLQLRGVT